ncbi:MAG: geranylgeranylglyceryl/heptaprenylglyceryl phosphate synthase [Paludibacter sp.]|jgi:putative glycerol-1-phosphate prenyltransferase|nr:geranylgeranylglyceryl/heptaprenylglyceryl phosphate synthase [Paludibacter sp.]
MKHTIYRKILLNRESGKKMFAVLIDPEKSFERNFASVVAALKVANPDFVFIGGSHTLRSSESIIEILKEEISSDILLFPGDASQFAPNADALLYLSLISGRNPEFLIGQHIKSSLAIADSDIEVIPTAYVLIDGGRLSAVEYFSNTRAIPRDKPDIALSTVMAGELLGMRLTYLEAGSGAAVPVPAELISFVGERILSPLIVGGGITSLNDLSAAYDAGADIIVVGNAFEKNPARIIEFVSWVDEYNKHHEKDENLPVIRES